MEQLDARTFWTLVLVLLAGMAYRYIPRWQARSPFVEPAKVKARLDAGEDVVIVDVRTEYEFQGSSGHIEGAVNLPLGDLRARILARDRDLGDLKGQRILVYCQGETRAARAARQLRDAGFTRVMVLKGGFRAWRRARGPIEKKP